MIEGIVLTDKQIATLAELSYMRLGKEKAWKDLEDTQRQDYVKAVKNFFDDLAKVGFEPRPLGEFKTTRAVLHAAEVDLTIEIKNFIQEKISVPKNLVAMFPHGELGIHLLKKFGPEAKK